MDAGMVDGSQQKGQVAGSPPSMPEYGQGSGGCLYQVWDKSVHPDPAFSYPKMCRRKVNSRADCLFQPLIASSGFFTSGDRLVLKLGFTHLRSSCSLTPRLFLHLRAGHPCRALSALSLPLSFAGLWVGWGWGSHLYYVSVSPANFFLFMRSFFPSMCRRYSFHSVFFFREKCSMCRCWVCV